MFGIWLSKRNVGSSFEARCEGRYLQQIYFRHVEVERSLIYDAVGDRVSVHRRQKYGVLASSRRRHQNHWLLNDHSLSRASPTCFEVVLQKTTAFAGDFLSRQLLRDAVYERCSVKSLQQDLIVTHHGTRQWTANTILHYLSSSFDGYEWTKNLKVTKTLAK